MSMLELYDLLEHLIWYFWGLVKMGIQQAYFQDMNGEVFPGSPDTLAVFNAPKSPQHRVSMSAIRLSRSRQVTCS